MTSELPPDAGEILTALARSAIAREMKLASPTPPQGVSWLDEIRATYVTLTISDDTGDSALRGSAGSLIAARSLSEDVQINAQNAAFHDKRFMPLTVEDLPQLTVSVAVLTPLEELTFSNEEEAIAQLRPGIDGVVFQTKDAHATFLPQMWDDLPNPMEFLQVLRLKAQVRLNYWGPDVQLFTFQTVSYTQAPLTAQS